MPKRPPKIKLKRPAALKGPQPVKPRQEAKETAFEAEVLPGLEPFALAELKGVSGVQEVRQEAGAVAFRFVGDRAKLSALRTVVAVYQVFTFAVPRPKALLGHEHFSRLIAEIDKLRNVQKFGGFRLSAAGDDSVVFGRLGEGLAQATGLARSDDGELLIRFRHSSNGWEVLLRLTPRPLSARPWRFCNLGGGLNAALAAVMVDLAEIQGGESVFNPMCGSGTLLVEAGLRHPDVKLLGCDLEPKALTCSAENAAAAGIAGPELLSADATATGLEAGSINVVLCDPPWGDAIGTHRHNETLYPAFLAECARIAAPGARLVLLTHEIRLLERVLQAQNGWQVQQEFRVFHGGHYPRVWLLYKE